MQTALALPRVTSVDDDQQESLSGLGTLSRLLPQGWVHQPTPSPEQPFVAAEVRALLRYVSESGLDPQGTTIRPLYDALLRYETAETTSPTRHAAALDVLEHYGRLAALPGLKGVNGRTILCSRSTRASFNGLLFWCVANLFCAVASEMAHFVDKLSPQPDGTMLQVLQHLSSLGVINYVDPFFWGGLGAAVSLIKQTAERVSAHTFDAHKLQGYTARIFLGAVFAAIVVNALEAEQAWVSASGLAFVCGLGVKAVYAAFEVLVEGVHARISSLHPASKIVPS